MGNDLTRKALGAALGISGAAVTKAAKLGMPTHSVEAAQRWRAGNVKPYARAAPPSAPAAAQAGTLDESQPEQPAAEITYQEAKRRQAVAEAMTAERNVQLQAGELVRVDDVRNALAQRLIAAREVALGASARLAPLVAAQSDVRAVRTIIDEEMHRMLAELSQAGTEFTRGRQV